jgi:hypothetical protein
LSTRAWSATITPYPLLAEATSRLYQDREAPPVAHTHEGHAGHGQNVRQFSVRLDEFREVMGTVQKELGKMIYGQQGVIRQLLATVFARGHCLLVGVPGLAKTLLVSTSPAFSRSRSSAFSSRPT